MTAPSSERMEIVISALGPSISEQCNALGLESVGLSLELADRISRAITISHIHGMLTDAETERARKRLMRRVKLRRKP